MVYLAAANIQRRAFNDNVVAQLWHQGYPCRERPTLVRHPASRIITGLLLGYCSDCPWNGWNTVFQFLDSFSWTKGRHTIKFGGDFRRVRFNNAVPGRPRGRFKFLMASSHRIPWPPTVVPQAPLSRTSCSKASTSRKPWSAHRFPTSVIFTLGSISRMPGRSPPGSLSISAFAMRMSPPGWTSMMPSSTWTTGGTTPSPPSLRAGRNRRPL